MLVIGGGLEMRLAAFSNGWKAGLSIFLAGTLAVLAGVVIWIHPLLGSLIFTLLMVGYFIVDGVSRSIQAFRCKPARALERRHHGVALVHLYELRLSGLHLLHPVSHLAHQ